MKDYIVLDIGKIVILRDKGIKNYYKEIDGNLVKLTDQELMYVINLFNKNDGYHYDSERLTMLVNNNSKIDNHNREYLLKLLEFLEIIIPTNCRDNFYRNIETVSIELNFDYDFQSLSMDKENMYSQSGGYNTSKNELKLLPESLKRIWEIAQSTGNPIEFYQKEVSLTLLHELAHMASTNYNKHTLVSLCGFDRFPAESENDRNRGLTEGMTEVIAMAGVPGTVEIASGYYIEALFINQLIQIVGLDVITESYFANKGTQYIENKLNEVISNKEMASLLFRRIEDNYQVRNIDSQQTFLGNVQSMLVSYFCEKISKQLFENNMSAQELNIAFSNFEMMLITPQKLEIMKKRVENYVGLNESLELFYQKKRELEESFSIDKNHER